MLALALLGSPVSLAQSGPTPVQPSEYPSFRVDVGANASVRRLPRAGTGVVEMVVRGVDVNLRARLTGNTPQIEGMDAVNQGGGVWLVRMTLRRSDLDVVPRIDNGALVFDIVPRQDNPLRLRIDAPTLDQLVRDELPPTPPAQDPPSHFRFLPGDALAQPLNSWEYEPELVRTPELMFEANWDRVDQARLAMLAAAPGSRQHQEQLYYLGYYYLELGFGREAHHYLSLLSQAPGPVAQKDIALERARAAQAVGRFDEARAWYKEAHFLGADHDSIVEGLALISLATGTPARAPTARLLWSSTSATGPLLLAAELLQMDGRVAESRHILEAVGEDVEGAARQRWALRLGDARFYDGEYQGAVNAWAQAETDMRSVRQLFFRLHKSGGDPSKWAKEIPSLVQASMPRTDAGAEALYLLSQIDREIMAAEDAINDLAVLLQRHPQKAEGSDVPERFWAIYSQYIGELAGAERWFDIAAIHETVWHKSVRRAVSDPRGLLHVARAYEEVGLPERAVVVLRDAVSVLVASGVDDPALVFRLAELYGQVNNWADGLATLDYLDEMGAALEDPGQVPMLRARLHEGAGNLPAARTALRVAIADPRHRDEAQLRLGVIDAEDGQCARAVPTLRRLLVPAPAQALEKRSRPYLALARCELVLGQGVRARQAADLAAARTTSDVEARYAQWLASLADGFKDADALDGLAKGKDFWALMAREQQDAMAFAEALETRRELPWAREPQ